MERHLFLIGPTGSGKSSLLRRILGAQLAAAGGFVTDSALGAYGELVGFTLSPAAAAAGVAGFVPERYLDCTKFPPRCDNEVFRRTGVRLLEEADCYPFALLDEIGGHELLIPPFREALYALLRSPLPTLGALKTFEEADALRQALGLGRKWLGCRETLDGFLAEDGDCRVIELCADPAGAEAAVEAWKNAYL